MWCTKWEPSNVRRGRRQFWGMPGGTLANEGLHPHGQVLYASTRTAPRPTTPLPDQGTARRLRQEIRNLTTATTKAFQFSPHRHHPLSWSLLGSRYHPLKGGGPAEQEKPPIRRWPP